jgi:hypothetical protein
MNVISSFFPAVVAVLALSLNPAGTFASVSATVRVPDTGQVRCYDNSGPIDCPGPDQPFYGQDAQYANPAPAYRDNGDGTVTDLTRG